MDSKLSALPAITAPLNADLVYTVQAGDARRVTQEIFRALIVEAGSTANPAPTGQKRIFLDSEKDSALSAIDDAGNVTIVDEFIDEAQSTAATLESNYPAASNQGLFAWVAGTTAENGLYQSNGVQWAKLLDNCGDQTELPDYGAGLVDSGQNDLSLQAGTPFWVQSDGATPCSTTDLANAFNNNPNDFASALVEAEYLGSYLYKEFAGATTLAMRKFRWDNNTTTRGVLSAYVVGWDGATFTRLSVVSVTGDGTNFGDLISLNASLHDVTITTTNTTPYRGYGMEIITTQNSATCRVSSISGEIVSDNTANITPVRTIRKLYRGYQEISDAITTATTLDETVNIVKCDASGGAFNVTLPAIGGVDQGKTYELVKTDTTNNIVTILPDGLDVINGNVELSIPKEGFKLISNGTSWDIINRTRFSSVMTTLTDAANVAVDGRLGPTFKLSPTQDFTLDNATSLAEGVTYVITFVNDATPRSITYDTAYLFANGDRPNLTQVAGAKDKLIMQRYESEIHCRFMADIS